MLNSADLFAVMIRVFFKFDENSQKILSKKGFENKYFSSLIVFLRGSKSCNSAFSGAYANFGISESQARLPWLVQ